jgi:hypothetical protein
VRKSRAKTPGAKPGGQPGNKNALKHGYWATHVADAKKVELSLAREITWLRGFVERTSDKLDGPLADPALYTDEALKTLRVQLEAIRDIGHLLQVHALLIGDAGQLEKEIEEGLFLARSDLGILDYLALPETVAGAADSGSDAES